MADKAVNRIPLVIGKIGIVILNLLQIGHIGKKLLGICKILVNVIEVPKKDISPEDELIQRFRLRIKLPVTLIKTEQQPDLVGRSHCAYLIKEIVDRQHLRHLQRNIRTGCHNGFSQILPEESHRTPVRKDEASVFDLSRTVMILRNLF